MASDRDLGAADLERLATCAYLSGDVEGALAAWEGAHQVHLAGGDVVLAARCAFHLAFFLLNHDARARGNGWTLRGQRLLDQAGADCVERGYLRYCAALNAVLDGDVDEAEAGFADAAVVGDRFADMELVALGHVGQGRCLIRRGQAGAGIALLDEAMALASVSEVSLTAMGDLYCTAIEGCQEIFDVRRAQEWTEALQRWCEAHPALVLYRGQCMVHRAELMLLGGRWATALEEVHRAVERLARPRSQPALGAAYYVRGELQRLRGQYAEAERAFHEAGRFGRHPQPGLALVWLARGEAVEAQSGLRRTLAAADGPVPRAPLLGPYVTVALAAGDRAAARAAAEELSGIARTFRSPFIDAAAEQALGTVLLAEADGRAALALLRRARAGWTELEAPHDAAQARALIGLAFRVAGDEESARAELDAARAELVALDLSADLIRCAERAVGGFRPATAGLTSREVEVVRLLATGVTNRAIAAELFISERTVATHVGSILRKLSLPSRAAVTRYAHQNHLV
jgi:DNA-binding NarL/FixJ family response regulator